MYREDHQASEENNENGRYAERSNYSPHYKRNAYSSSERAGDYNRDRDYNREDHQQNTQRGGYRPKNDGYSGGGYPQDRDYNREDHQQSTQRDGYRPKSDGYNRDRDYSDRNYNRDDSQDTQRDGYRPIGGSGYSGGGYNRDRSYTHRNEPRGPQREGYKPRSSGNYSGDSYNRDRSYTHRDEPRGPQREGYKPRSSGSYSSGGYNRDRDYSNRNDQRGGYKPGGGSGYNRNDRGESRDRGGQRQETYRPRPRPNLIFIQDSQFLLPDHDLNQEFQRAIGMAKGTIIEVDARKKRGTIEIDGHTYKFEDERNRDYQRKYPIEKFLDREIQFAFWPTYSQKAAQYRKIDESPTIKIANLRRTLPDPNFVEIIGEVMMVEENLFVLSIFSKSQKKKYLVTIMGSMIAETGDLIQMFGKLKNGEIHYSSHRLIPVGEAAVAAKAAAKAKADATEKHTEEEDPA